MGLREARIFAQRTLDVRVSMRVALTMKKQTGARRSKIERVYTLC
jgi:hypothetical protein